MLHAALHWPEQADISLWPMALTYATYLWNITPRPETELSPLEILARSKQLTPLIHHMHVWVVPRMYWTQYYKMERNFPNGEHAHAEECS